MNHYRKKMLFIGIVFSVALLLYSCKNSITDPQEGLLDERILFIKIDDTITEICSIKPLAEGLEAINNTVIPDDSNLKHNFPNPFNPSTTIAFDLLDDSQVNLVVFNIKGQEVAKLVDSFVPAGSYNVKFPSKARPPGLDEFDSSIFSAISVSTFIP